MKLSEQLKASIYGPVPDDYWTAQAIDALSSEHYRSGLMGLFKDLQSRRNTVLFLKRWYQRNFAPFLDDKEKAIDPTWDLEFAAPHCASAGADAHAQLSWHDQVMEKLDLAEKTFRQYLARLDKCFTIDHRPKWASKARKALDHFSRDFLYDLTGYRPSGCSDEFTEELKRITKKRRVADYRDRLLQELRFSQEEGWFVVFDTLTLNDDRWDQFFATPTAIRDHCRKIGRLINKRLGRKARDSYTDVFRYFVVPEFGKKGDRLHFHCLYFCKELPYGSYDPNVGQANAYRREIKSFKVWEYGFSSPVAMRYSGDAFTRAGWRWPVERDKKTGHFFPVPVKPADAVAFYVTKYATKNVEDGDGKCLKDKKKFRIRMSRNLGMRVRNILFIMGLTTQSCIQLTRLHWSVTKKARMIRRCASAELKRRLAKQSLQSFLDNRKPRITLLERLRALSGQSPSTNLQRIGTSQTPALMIEALSDEARAFVRMQDYRPKGALVSGP